MATTELTACEQAALDLAEVKAALKTLTLGGAIVRVTSYGRTTEFAPSRRDDLIRLRSQLQAQVDACNNVGRRSGFLRFTPGDDR